MFENAYNNPWCMLQCPTSRMDCLIPMSGDNTSKASGLSASGCIMPVLSNPTHMQLLSDCAAPLPAVYPQGINENWSNMGACWLSVDYPQVCPQGIYEDWSDMGDRWLQGYKSAGQLETAMGTLKWAAEFLMEAHFFKAKLPVRLQSSTG